MTFYAAHQQAMLTRLVTFWLRTFAQCPDDVKAQENAIAWASV